MDESVMFLEEYPDARGILQGEQCIDINCINKYHEFLPCIRGLVASM